MHVYTRIQWSEGEKKKEWIIGKMKLRKMVYRTGKIQNEKKNRY